MGGIPEAVVRAHVVLGYIVVGLFIYMNLVYRGMVKPRLPVVAAMRSALASWLTTFGLGMYVFSVLGPARLFY